MPELELACHRENRRCCNSQAATTPQAHEWQNGNQVGVTVNAPFRTFVINRQRFIHC